MQQKQILIDGKILHYYEYKSGKKENILVFLHGWMQDGKSFGSILNILEKQDISYVSLDLPGFGNSALQSDDMNIDAYSDITQKFITKLGLLQPILIGHSFGGRICIKLGSYSSNISKIVLICAAGVQNNISPIRYIILKIGKFVFSLPGLKILGKKIQAHYASPDAKNAGKMINIFHNTIAEDLQDAMKKNTFPTLMIWGNNDTQTPVGDAEIIHRHIKNSQLYILEGTHFIHQEKAQEVTHLILDFIKK